MISAVFTESIVKQVALAWLDSCSYTVRHGPEIAPGEPAAERQDYGQVVLERRPHDTLPPKLISGELRVKGTKRGAGTTI